jgi:hypothetical protein
MKLLRYLPLLFFGLTLQAQFLENTSEKTKFEGFFDFYYTPDKDKIFLVVDQNQLGQDFLYVHALRTGLGSNDIGLDRGQLGGEQVVRFEKSGPRLLLMAPNLQFRANSENYLERQSVGEAFGTHVLFGFDIVSEAQDKYLVDLTDFLLQDTHKVTQTLAQKKQGSFKLNKGKSVLWLQRTKAFPLNVEFEALLTFDGQPTGKALKSVWEGSELSTIQHHSFVALPDDDYKMRPFDPRCGAFPMTFYDYATPIDQPLKQQYITRHRLEKKFPDQAMSPAVEPIIYYLDPGTPEPIRSALLEGAQWWNQAFEAIGYQDAFQVALLPEDADPLDVRYNVIQWVHRSTRGWSYGASITDPRTGEIIKGHVSLGSLRVRQDFLIAQGLSVDPFAQDKIDPAMQELALARLRQLSAHEVGHTLGFAHNFAASAYGKVSVMDYPHPQLSIKNGLIDYSKAYETGIGLWDKISVAYSYGDIPDPSNQIDYLRDLLDKAFAQNLLFITDSDARATSGSHAQAHLWDNASNAATGLDEIMAVRSVALNQFSLSQIPSGQPHSVLEDVFVPIYYLHRYQTEAATKMLGGSLYDYSIKGAKSAINKAVSPTDQRHALNSILNTLSPLRLHIPKGVEALFPPRAFGYPRTRESFKSAMGLNFDPVTAAGSAASMTLELLLHPARLNRIYWQQVSDPNQLSLDELLEKSAHMFNTAQARDRLTALNEYVLNLYLRQIMAASVDKQSLPQVKSKLKDHLYQWERWAKKYHKDMAAHYLDILNQYWQSPEDFDRMETPELPDGSPIGSDLCIFPDLK